MHDERHERADQHEHDRVEREEVGGRARHHLPVLLRLVQLRVVPLRPRHPERHQREVQRLAERVRDGIEAHDRLALVVQQEVAVGELEPVEGDAGEQGGDGEREHRPHEVPVPAPVDLADVRGQQADLHACGGEQVGQQHAHRTPAEDGDEDDGQRHLDEDASDGIAGEDPRPVLQPEQRERQVVEIAEEEGREGDREVAPVAGIVFLAEEEGDESRQEHADRPQQDQRVERGDVEDIGDDPSPGRLRLVVEIEAAEGDVEAEGHEDIEEGRDRDDHAQDAVVRLREEGGVERQQQGHEELLEGTTGTVDHRVLEEQRVAVASLLLAPGHAQLGEWVRGASGLGGCGRPRRRPPVAVLAGDSTTGAGSAPWQRRLSGRRRSLGRHFRPGPRQARS